MGKPKKKHKKAKQLPLSKEEQIFQAARDLAAEIGISYSEALGFTLGIKDVTYGWEDDYTEEEFQALIDHAVGDTDYEHTLYWIIYTRGTFGLRSEWMEMPTQLWDMRQMPCSERQKWGNALCRLYRRQAVVYGYNTGNKK